MKFKNTFTWANSVILGFCCWFWASQSSGVENVPHTPPGMENIVPVTPKIKQTQILCTKGVMPLNDFLNLPPNDLPPYEQKMQKILKGIAKNKNVSFPCPLNIQDDVPDKRVAAYYENGIWILNCDNTLAENQKILGEMPKIFVNDSDKIAICCKKDRIGEPFISSVIKITGNICDIIYPIYNGEGNETDMKMKSYTLAENNKGITYFGNLGVAYNLTRASVAPKTANSDSHSYTKTVSYTH